MRSQKPRDFSDWLVRKQQQTEGAGKTQKGESRETRINQQSTECTSW